MYNVIIETATKRFENFLSENQEQVNHSKTLYLVTMYLSGSPILEKYLGEIDLVHNMKLKNLQNSALEELQKLTLSGEVISTPINYLDAIGIRSWNYITVVCGLPFELNYKFLREVLLRAKELTPEMVVKLQTQFEEYVANMIL